MENTSCRWPVSVKSGSFEIFVSFLEQEVVSNELFLFWFFHSFKRIVSTLEVSFKGGEGLFGITFDLFSLFFGNESSKWDTFEISCDSNTSRFAVFVFWVEIFKIACIRIPATLVFGIGTMSVVILYDFIEKRSESSVRIWACCINSDWWFWIYDTWVANIG